MSTFEIILIVLLAISEGLSMTDKFKANSILQAVVQILKAVKDVIFSKKPK